MPALAEQNGTRFLWTKAREKAALLVAEDARTDEEIATAVGVGRTTLHTWKQQPSFMARVEQHVATFREKIVARGIAERQNRVDALNDRWGRMQRVIEARAAEHWENPAVAGAEEGLHVRTVKLSATGKEVEEYAIDTPLLKEIRAHEEQAAKELGQWTERQDVTSGGKALKFSLMDVRAALGIEIDATS